MSRLVRIAVCFTSLAFLLSSRLDAQTVVQGGAWQGWQQSSIGQSIYWLQNPQLQKELEIVAEQIDKLREVQKESQTRLQEAYRNMGDVPAEERQAKYMEIYREHNADLEKQVLDILLPQQIKRLKQILLQQRLSQLQWGGAAAFQSADVAEALGITDEQRQQLQQREQELRKEIQEKTQAFYKQLQEESREKMLEVLTIEQRRRLEGLVGDKFEWQTGAYQQPAQGGSKAKE